MNTVQREFGNQSLIGSKFGMVAGALDTTIPGIWAGRAIFIVSFAAFSASAVLAFYF